MRGQSLPFCGRATDRETPRVNSSPTKSVKLFEGRDSLDDLSGLAYLRTIGRNQKTCLPVFPQRGFPPEWTSAAFLRHQPTPRQGPQISYERATGSRVQDRAASKARPFAQALAKGGDAIGVGPVQLVVMAMDGDRVTRAGLKLPTAE